MDIIAVEYRDINIKIVKQYLLGNTKKIMDKRRAVGYGYGYGYIIQK